MARLFYNTNGFAFHRLTDAIQILGELGYDGVAITPDVHHLDPYSSSPSSVAEVRSALERAGLDVVLETGARFVLDPRTKHRPSLYDDSAGAARRLDLLVRCVDLARDLGAPVVSTWSGSAPEDLGRDDAQRRLVEGLRRLCDHAAARGVRVGFEPEPGMEVETVAEWTGVRDAVDHEALGLTLDVGHCLATREGDPAEIFRAHAAEILVVQLDDHRPGVHDHLFFGEGEVDFTSIASAARDVGFDGPLEVELSRHSATAPVTARDALTFLRGAFGGPPRAAR